MECEALWTVLWNFGHCKQFCGMRDAGDIFLFFILGAGYSSVECGALGTVLWNVKYCEHIGGIWGGWDSWE